VSARQREIDVTGKVLHVAHRRFARIVGGRGRRRSDKRRNAGPRIGKNRHEIRAEAFAAEGQHGAS